MLKMQITGRKFQAFSKPSAETGLNKVVTPKVIKLIAPVALPFTKSGWLL
jgi:hypothetical protein